MIPAQQTVPHFQGSGRIGQCSKPVPTPGAGELLLQVQANALCGSERGQFQHGSQVTPGHEATGHIVAAGPGTQTPIGTPGVVFLMDFCGACRSCLSGATNQCLAKRADMGFSHDGGYGQYMLIHENIFYPCDSDINAAEATLLLDIMGTGGHAIARAQLICAELESLFIVGAGPIGLGVLAMARLLLGPKIPVFISDVNSYRLQLAEKLGGQAVDLQKNTPAEAIKKAGLSFVDAAIDTSGKGAARRAALDILAQRGALVCAGHGENLDLQISRDLIAPERAVLGSEYFRYDEFPRNLKLLRQQRAYLAQIITHRLPVKDLQRAFEIFFGGNSGKVIIEQ